MSKKPYLPIDGEPSDFEDGAPQKTDMREELLLAGIAELEAHGLGGFSLRRVAAACGVSCAAPYKHFESKECFISAILDYIHEKWTLLEEHICAVFPHDARERLLSLCLSNIRFWIGNPHFRSIRMMEAPTAEEGKAHLGKRAEAELAALCAQANADHARTAYTLRSLVYGAILMLEDGTLPNDPSTFRMLRTVLSDAIPPDTKK